MKIFRKVKLFIIIGLMTVLSFAIFSNKTSYAASIPGLGDSQFQWEREIYDGVNLSHVMSHNFNNEQKTYTIEFNPKTTALRPVVTVGKSVLGGVSLSALVDDYESRGHHVVFGVNGDGYDTSNWIASGISINDGILINSSNNKLGWGITADGDVKFGNASLPMSFTIEGQSPISLTHVNKERKLDTNGVYLMNELFNATTDSTQAGVEVILKVDEGQDGIRIGQPYNLTVENVVTVQNNVNKNKTQIGQGKAVLATHANSPHYDTLAALTPGKKVTVNVNDNTDSRINWSEIVAGMGIFHLLMENGEPVEAHMGNTDIHPRTSMGVKADGTIVLMQNDGRQVGWANGLSFAEMVTYMRDVMGVVHLFNFDGGGSSTISATLPGDTKATVLNRPSDGRERSNANAFLLVATEEPTVEREIEKIHIYPSIANNYATKGMILEKGKMSFYVTATDLNHYPAPINEPINYRIENDGTMNIGTIDSAGNFTAGTGSGTGRVIASIGDKEAVFDVEVVNQITKVETTRTIISVGPYGSTTLEFRAFKDGVPIILSTDSLKFTVTPSEIGSVSSSGKFTAAVESGVGELTVSYKTFSLEMPIEIGKLPVPIVDFERDIFADHSWVKHYIGMPNNGGWGDISINTDERYIKHGDGSLRIDYDFATNPLTDTVAIEISQHGGTVLEGQPKAISAWVYGDGQGGWFRIQLTGGKYAGDTKIDWVGWRYIETPIPTDAPFPYTVQKMVRLLGTATIANNTRGTIYVDSVRAVYDYKNDDNSAPEVIEESISPAQGTSTANRQQVISLKVKDSDVAPVTGIDIERTQMFINNKQVDNLQQIVNADGSVDITYNPSALTRLRPGVQNIRVRVEDNFGNKKFIEWSFLLEGYAVHLNEIAPDKDVIYAGEEFSYIIDTPSYRDFEQVQIELEYNPNSLDLLADIVDDRLIVSEKDINETTGKIVYTLIGMKDHQKGDATLFKFNFKAKETFDGSTGIKVTKSIITENTENVDLILQGYDVELAYKYLINVFETTVGRETRILLTENQQPVNGVQLVAYKGSEQVVLGPEYVTNENGEIITNVFTDYPVGTQFSLHFVKEGLVSNTVLIQILESLGSVIPEKINVTVGANPAREVGISFQTSHAVTAGKVYLSENEDMSNERIIDAEPATVYTFHNNNNCQYTAWGAFVNELTPGTKYYYQVGSDLGKSEILSFRTPNETGDLNIAIYGDIQGGYSTLPTTIGRLYSMYPDIDFSLIAGDVADNAHVYNNWTSLDTFSKQYFNNGIWASAIGNHDTTDNGLTFTRYFYGPLNGVEPSLGARNYYFEIGDIIIYNFDTEAGFNSYDTSYTRQKAHLLEVMRNTDKTFKVVLMHRSAYPLNYNELNIRALAPTFEEAGIDLVISGHDHVYNRVSMLGGNKVELHEGVTYVVTGTSSGGKYYDGDATRPWAGVVYDDNNPVFMIMKIRDGKRLEYETYAVEGGVSVLRDSFVIEKNEVTVEEGNFTYDGPAGFITGGTLKFKIKPNEGYYVDSVTVNDQVVTYDDDGYYNISGLGNNVVVKVTLLEGYNRYDINGDGVVTTLDAISILKHITGKEVISSERLALLGLTEADMTMAFAREILEMVGDE